MESVEAWTMKYAGKAYSTRITRNAAVNRFLEVMKEKKILTWEVNKITRAGKKEKRMRPPLPDKKQLLAMMDDLSHAKDAKSIRLWAWFSLFIGVGMRRGEVVGLRLDQLINTSEGWIFKEVDRKHNHIDDIPIVAAVTHALRRWLKIRLVKPVIKKPTKFDIRRGPRWESSEYIFPGRYGGPITHALLWSDLERIGASQGIKLHPHLLRKCYITYAFKAGAPIHAIRDQVGLNSIKSLKSYMRPDIGERKMVSEKVQEIIRMNKHPA
jgi:integrase